MKTYFPKFAAISLLFVLLFGCEKENRQDINPDPGAGIKEAAVSYTDCKPFDKNTDNVINTSEESCIEYSYDPQTLILMLKHINTGFNCCPEILYVTVYVVNDTITIEEDEKEQLCLCRCLYDIDMEIHDILPGEYHVKVVEPYCGDQEKLEFRLDLNDINEGTYCVPRTEYPWNV